MRTLPLVPVFLFFFCSPFSVHSAGRRKKGKRNNASNHKKAEEEEEEECPGRPKKESV